MRRSIHGLVQHAAERRPDGLAATLQGATLSWSELATSAAQVARVLHEVGLRPGDRVAVLLGKELHVPAAIYGIMTAGAAWVPIDPAAPPSRQAAILRDAGAQVLVTSPAQASTLADLLAEFGASGGALRAVLGVEDQAHVNERISWEDVHAAPPMTDCPEVADQDLAYLIYTSGTTGPSKGIMHSHESGVTYGRWAVRTYGITEDDRLSNESPLHFDMSTFDWYAAAAAGACTVVVPTAHRRMPASHSALLADERVSVVFAVPFALSQLVTRGALDERDLGSLRWIVFGGEVPVTAHIRALMEALPHTRFSNMYGPAETNGCTQHVLSGLPEPDDAISIGRAFEHMQTRVVDDGGREVGPGDTGELWVAGKTTMLGYWGRPDLNARAFQDVEDDGEYRRFYKTGDVVLVAEDGSLTFVGRKDRQVKVRGYRVELEEVEAALAHHPAVYAVAAFPEGEPGSARTITAAAQLKPDSVVTADQLRRAVAEELPPYAVPTAIRFMKELPRTGGGKIDRVRLRHLAMTRAAEE